MWKTITAAFMAFLVPVAAHAAQPGDANDVRILLQAAHAIDMYPQYTVFDNVDLSVDGAVVTVTGFVTMGYKRDDIGRLVGKVAGVKSVDNRIALLPVSSFDDQLRLRIARAIYGNAAFWNYAMMANPPIHIIVNGGHVTLAGVVNNEVERFLARSLASGTNAFSVKNELKTDAEVRAMEKVS